MSRDAEATREALLDGAEQLFAERGFDGASLQALSERTGVNKAMVSYHFGGKDGLYRAVLRRVLGLLREPYEQLRASDRRPSERLRGMIELVARTSAERPALPAILLREHLAGGSRIDGDVLEDLKQGFYTTQHLLEEGTASGELVPADAHLLHLSLVGSLTFFLVSRPLRDEHHRGVSDVSLDAFVRHTQDLFVRALGAADAETRPRRIGVEP